MSFGSRSGDEFISQQIGCPLAVGTAGENNDFHGILSTARQNIGGRSEWGQEAEGGRSPDHFQHLAARLMPSATFFPENFRD